MSDRHPRGFASDNNSGAHPEVVAAIAAANEGHVVAYGDDDYTAATRDRFRHHFGERAEPFIVFNGSGANVAAIDALTRPYEGVICTEVAHMHVDECGAPERLAGAKLLAVPTEDGKLTPSDVRRWEEGRGDEHRVQPRVVSITQATELGTVYTPDETRAIADTTHELGMYLHVDGARLANAAASLEAPLRALTTDLGVDVLSFGGTKNGLLLGDAVVFLRPELAEAFRFTRKQLGQLASKMRFLAVQFDALLGGDLWRANASHANAMARRLADAVSKLDGARIAYPVEANGVFLSIPAGAIERLRDALPASLPFYVWDEAAGTIRLMCSWDTTDDDVDGLATALAEAL
ncbi:MAG: threonine aldolase family protein [Solirubrobacterales bacterium]